MNINDKFETQFIRINSIYYKEALSLRQRTFIRPYNESESSLMDRREESSFHLIAIYDSRVVGYARLTIERDIGYISQMVVENEMQGEGIGTQLLIKLLEKAREMNVRVFLNALSYYRELRIK